MLKYFNKKHIFEVVICFVLIIVQVWFDLKLPDYMSQVTKLVQSSGSDILEILKYGGLMLGCALGSLLAAIIVGYFATKISAEYSYNLRDSVYKKVLGFSKDEISNFSTASLITRTTNDVTNVRIMIALGGQILIKAPLLALLAIVKILEKEVSWTIATAVVVASLLVFIGVLLSISLPKFQKVQKFTDAINRVVRESLTGLRVVRAYNSESYEFKKFDKANQDITQNNLFVNRIAGLLGPFMTIMMNGLSLSIYIIGAYLIASASGIEKLNIFSEMVVFTSYAMQVVMAFMMMTMLFIQLPRTAISARRIFAVLNTENKIFDGTHTTETTSKGKIEFRNVEFKYPDAKNPVLEDLNFTIESGQTVAIIGSTASGKSTLIHLMLRFFDTTKGQVLVDGIDVKDYPCSTLRDKISYVSQKATLFKGTVLSNVQYADLTTRSIDYKKAIAIAQAEDFVLKNGYDYRIAQGGSNLSGGQKQRISIARAIAKNGEIYIFDDSFSALDYKTDKTLRQALKNNIDATVIMVAQRISTIKDADKIIVLNDGKIASIGTHQQLIESCSIYQEIVDSQLTKEEQEYETK